MPQHHRERADDRHGHGDQRNERRPPRLQERQHDDRHENDGVAQGLEDFVDRFVDERRRVVDDGVVQVGRKVALQLVHPLADRLGGVERVGAGLLKDAPGRWTAGRRGCTTCLRSWRRVECRRTSCPTRPALVGHQVAQARELAIVARS